MTGTPRRADGGLAPLTTTAVVATWCGEPALPVVGGDGSVLLVVPGRSAKVASLVDPEGLERLAQPRRPLGRPSGPGAAFVESEMCGWDECAPAVLPGRAVVAGWEVAVPDHGELWTARWSCRRVGDAVVAEVRGRSQDYRLRRTIAPRPRGFRWTYRVDAGAAPVALCWVAHPQFRAPSGSRVHVAARTAVDVVAPGRPRRAWPEAGIAVDDVVPGGSAKVYAAPEQPVGAARLTTPGRVPLLLSWDAAVVPYCGVWVDRARWAGEDVVAIEPATGFADDLADAVGSGRVLLLAPGGTATWWLDVECGPAN